jgi:multidrug efflux system outer membrane protein
LPLSDLATDAAAVWPAKDWWRRYQDPTLDRLIEQALTVSPTLATAHARFDSARQSVRLAGSASGAQVSLNGDAGRQRLSDHGLISPGLLGFDWYDQADLGLQANYTFDWWGRQRAVVASAMDAAHAAQADRSAAALQLAAVVADTYFGWQGDQARSALAAERLQLLEREASAVAARVAAQLDPADSLRQADARVAAAREDMARLDGSAKMRVVALAALVGRPAAELPALRATALPPVAAALPEHVRLDLVARRADITASRWRVEAAQHDVEGARADFFPNVSINALGGLSTIDFAKLLEYGSRVPEAGAAVHLPLFDAGRLKARYGASQAAIDAAVAAYDATLVEAARDVATQVTTRAELAARRHERLLQVEDAYRLQKSAAARVKQGLSDVRTELAAAESWVEQRDALLQLDAAALSADIGLQRALGGGYEGPASFANDVAAPK